jgi:hypothetical protein
VIDVAAFVASRRHLPSESTIELHGAITPLDVPNMRRRLSAALEGEPHDLMVDMRGVWDLCPKALAVLVGAHSRQRSLHRKLTLVMGLGSATERALVAAGMQGRMPTVSVAGF